MNLSFHHHYFCIQNVTPGRLDTVIIIITIIITILITIIMIIIILIIIIIEKIKNTEL